MPPIKVLIAEDHALLVDAALQMLLGTAPEIECVGAARDGEQALALAQSLHGGDVRCLGTGSNGVLGRGGQAVLVNGVVQNSPNYTSGSTPGTVVFPQ